MRDALKDLVPPIVVKAVRKFRDQRPVFYEDFESASSQCHKSGYDQKDLVRCIVEKSKVFRSKLSDNRGFDTSSFSILTAIGLANRTGSLNVLDFGGAAGYHFFIANAAFLNCCTLNWAVVETASMVAGAKSLSEDGLLFCDSISDAVKKLGRVDLVFASSALQYCPDPKAYLREILDVGAENVFITRTPFVQAQEQIITVQKSRLAHNGPGPLPPGFQDREIFYPITYMNQSEVEKTIEEKYEIFLRFNEGSGAFQLKQNRIAMTGFFCKRKAREST